MWPPNACVVACAPRSRSSEAARSGARLRLRLGALPRAREFRFCGSGRPMRALSPGPRVSGLRMWSCRVIRVWRDSGLVLYPPDGFRRGCRGPYAKRIAQFRVVGLVHLRDLSPGGRRLHCQYWIICDPEPASVLPPAQRGPSRSGVRREIRISSSVVQAPLRAEPPTPGTRHRRRGRHRGRCRPGRALPGLDQPSQR